MEHDNEPRVPFTYEAQMDEALKIASTGNFYGAIRWLRYASELNDQISLLSNLQLISFMAELGGTDVTKHDEQYEKTLSDTQAIDITSTQRLSLLDARVMGQSSVWLIDLYKRLPEHPKQEKIIGQARDWLNAYETELAAAIEKDPEAAITDNLGDELDRLTSTKQSIDVLIVPHASEPQANNLGALSLRHLSAPES